jgi:hypothetical protein
MADLGNTARYETLEQFKATVKATAPSGPRW